MKKIIVEIYNLNNINTDRRRQDYGRPEVSDDRGTATSPGGRSRSGLSSDAQRHALLTGDYSFLSTDKGRRRGQGGDDSWKRYLG